MASTTCTKTVLDYIVARDRRGEHLTIPALVQALAKDAPDLAEGSKLECAIRDLDGEGLLCCHKGCVYPTETALERRARPSLSGSLASAFIGLLVLLFLAPAAQGYVQASAAPSQTVISAPVLSGSHALWAEREPGLVPSRFTHCREKVGRTRCGAARRHRASQPARPPCSRSRASLLAQGAWR
jgi:hypothetical protein